MRTNYQIMKWLSDGKILILFIFLSSTYFASGQTQADFEVPERICNLRVTTFQNTSTIDLGDTVTYLWYFQDAIQEFSSEGAATWGANGQKNVTLKIYNQRGDSFQKTKSVFVKISAIADFEASGVCCGDEIVFTNTSTIGLGDLTYKWEFLDYDSSKTSCENIGQQRVKLKALTEEGCSDEITKQIIIYPMPDASFTIQKDGKTVQCFGPSGNDVYRWTFGDGGRDQAENPTYTYGNIEGDEVICLQTKKGVCWSEECQNLWSFGSVLSNEKLQWRMYPNPSNGIFNIELASYDDLIVIDALGNILSPTLIKAESGYRLDLNVFPSGVYTVKVIEGGAVFAKQIVLMK